jgi:hypothetical protein
MGGKIGQIGGDMNMDRRCLSAKFLEVIGGGVNDDDVCFKC